MSTLHGKTVLFTVLLAAAILMFAPGVTTAVAPAQTPTVAQAQVVTASEFEGMTAANRPHAEGEAPNKGPMGAAAHRLPALPGTVALMLVGGMLLGLAAAVRRTT